MKKDSLDIRIENAGKRLIREQRACESQKNPLKTSVRTVEVEKGLKSPKIAINRVSKKQSAKNAQLAKIKKELSPICVIPYCGCEGVDLCHLLPKSLYPEYYTKRENLVRMCRRHHNKFDDSLLFRQLQTELFKQVASFDERAAIKYFNYV